jgi:hypothetical protein
MESSDYDRDHRYLQSIGRVADDDGHGGRAGGHFDVLEGNDLFGWRECDSVVLEERVFADGCALSGVKKCGSLGGETIAGRFGLIASPFSEHVISRLGGQLSPRPAPLRLRTHFAESHGHGPEREGETRPSTEDHFSWKSLAGGKKSKKEEKNEKQNTEKRKGKEKEKKNRKKTKGIWDGGDALRIIRGAPAREFPPRVGEALHAALQDRAESLRRHPMS